MKNIAILSLIFLLTAASAAAQSDIRRVDFKNFTFTPYCASDETDAVTVKNGEFSSEKQMDGYVDRFYFNVFEIAYGDLTGDKIDEAVILTVCNTGGTGNFSEGFVYGLRSGKPLLLARIPGGDRAYGGLRTARVQSGLLIVEANDVGELGGACCPEFIVTTRYELRNEKLIEVGNAERRAIYPSQRVKFAPGTSGTTIKVTIPPNEGRHFVVGARAGQTLTVSASSSKAELSLLEDATTARNVAGFSARLPRTGDYTIQVANYESASITFTLNIKIR